VNSSSKISPFPTLSHKGGESESPHAGRGEESARKRLAQALLAPRSVAIVGQSNDASKTAGRPLKYLRQAGFAGKIYPVNPRRDEVLGERAWPALAALPEAPDHAYIVTPTEAAIEAVEECGKLGIKIATVLANGFSEAGQEGEAREARLREIAAQSGLRIVGPSSLGVVDLRSRLFLTANAAFAETDFPLGKIFVASHSGGMIGAIASRGLARSIHFAGFVSVGNEADLSVGEICGATLDDEGTDGYLLFLEHTRKAEHLRRFALGAAARGKPVIAYKLGRSQQARELAMSHTGALVGDDDVADAFLADCGIARVDTLDALIEGLPLLKRAPHTAQRKEAPTVAVVTTTAGGATMVVDPLGMRGVNLQYPGAETAGRLKAAGLEMTAGGLLDLTVAGTHYKAMKSALDILTTAPEYDMVVAVVGSSSRFHPELAVKPIIDSAGAAKPIAAFMVPDAPVALAQLAAAGVPSFRTPEACADAVAAALKRRAPRDLRRDLPAPARRADLRAVRTLDEAESYAVFDRLKIARAPSAVIAAGAKDLPELPFPYPVAVKVLSPDITHKARTGGVALNVASADELRAACEAVQAASRRYDSRANIRGVLVQPMIKGGLEFLIGYGIGLDVGPYVTVAAGGALTEVYRDRSVRLAPVDLATAREMMHEVRLLKATMGSATPSLDLDALARAIVALSQLAVIEEPLVIAAEINPLLVRAAGEGAIAVDALVQVAT
jgi:acyl-CoA synthetase (NDP forming)